MVSRRVLFVRLKEAGCRWAANFATRSDTRLILARIAIQYRDLAEQVELMDKLPGVSDLLHAVPIPPGAGLPATRDRKANQHGLDHVELEHKTGMQVGAMFD